MYKKGWIFLLVLAVFVQQASAQSLSEKELVGTWTVVKVNMLVEVSEEKAPAMEMITKMFLHGNFVFRVDHSFALEMMSDEMALEKGEWKYDAVTHILLIKDDKSKGSDDWDFMKITVVKDGHKVFFNMGETPLQLEVEEL